MSAVNSDQTESATKVYDTIPYLLAASVQIWQYQTVGIDGNGYANPISNTSGLKFVGYNLNPGIFANNTSGTAGAVQTNVRPIGNAVEDRFFVFNASSATQSWVNSLVYFTDSNTVSTTVGNGVAAGRVTQLLSASVVVVDASRQS